MCNPKELCENCVHEGICLGQAYIKDAMDTIEMECSFSKFTRLGFECDRKETELEFFDRIEKEWAI